MAEGGKEDRTAKRPRRRARNKSTGDAAVYDVYVGNSLPEWITEELLSEHFDTLCDDFSSTCEVRIVGIGRQRHGKLSFQTEEEALHAIDKVHNTELINLGSKYKLTVADYATCQSRWNSNREQVTGGQRDVSSSRVQEHPKASKKHVPSNSKSHQTKSPTKIHQPSSVKGQVPGRSSSDSLHCEATCDVPSRCVSSSGYDSGDVCDSIPNPNRPHGATLKGRSSSAQVSKRKEAKSGTGPAQSRERSAQRKKESTQQKKHSETVKSKLPVEKIEPSQIKNLLRPNSEETIMLNESPHPESKGSERSKSSVSHAGRRSQQYKPGSGQTANNALVQQRSEESQPTQYPHGLPDQGPRPLDQGPRPLDQGPRPLDQGPRPLDQGPRPLDQRPRPLDQGPRPLDQGPRPPSDMMVLYQDYSTTNCNIFMSKHSYQFFEKRFAAELAHCFFRFKNGQLSITGNEATCREFNFLAAQLSEISQTYSKQRFTNLVRQRDEGPLLSTLSKECTGGSCDVLVCSDETSCSVWFVGLGDRAKLAQETFQLEFDRRIPVDRLRLLVLTQLQPNLCGSVRSQCSLVLSGFEPGSCELVLSSCTAPTVFRMPSERPCHIALQKAKDIISEALKTVFFRKVSIKQKLIIPFHKYLTKRRDLANSVVLCSFDSKGLPQLMRKTTEMAPSSSNVVQMCVCSLIDFKKNVYIVAGNLEKGPIETPIDDLQVSLPLYQRLLADSRWIRLTGEAGVCTEYDPCSKTLSILHFSRQLPSIIVSNLTNCVRQCPGSEFVLFPDLSKSSSKLAFLIHILFTANLSLGQQLRIDLLRDYDAALSLSGRKVVCTGPAMHAQSEVNQVITSRLLTDFSSREIQVQCSPAQLPLVEKAVNDGKLSNEKVLVEMKRPGENQVKVIVSGCKVAAVHAVATPLENITPVTMCARIRPEEESVLTKAFISELEARFDLVIDCAKRGEHILQVHSLCSESATKVVKVLEDLSHCDRRYLLGIMDTVLILRKCRDQIDSITEVKVVFHLPDCSRDVFVVSENQNVSLIISGRGFQVKSAWEKIRMLTKRFVREIVSLDSSKYSFYSDPGWKSATLAALKKKCDDGAVIDIQTQQTSTSSQVQMITVAAVNSASAANVLTFLKDCSSNVERHEIESRSCYITDLEDAIKDGQFDHKGSVTHLEFKRRQTVGIVSLCTPLLFRDRMYNLSQRVNRYLAGAAENHRVETVHMDSLLATIIATRYLSKFKVAVTVNHDSHQNALCFEGNKDRVKKDIESLKQLKESLVCQLSTCTLTVPQNEWSVADSVPETRKFLSLVVKNNCVDVSVPQKIPQQQSASGAAWDVILQSTVYPSSPCRVQIIQGLLTTERADAIVLHNDPHLKLYDAQSPRGSLPWAVLKVGGDAIRFESDRYLSTTNGDQVGLGEAVAIGPGRLPCKGTIHAVCLPWTGGKSGEVPTLETAYVSSLEVAIQKKWKTVAFCPLGVDSFCTPMHSSAKCAVSAFVNILSVDKNLSQLDEIKIVIPVERSTAAFVDAFSDLQNQIEIRREANRSAASFGGIFKGFLGLFSSQKTPVVPANSNQASHKIRAIKNSDYEVVNSVPNVTIRIRGCSEDVDNAKLIIEQELIGGAFSVLGGQKLPRGLSVFDDCLDWENISDPLILKNIERKSHEFIQVQCKMHKTLPHVKIHSLQRVQNRMLWLKFEQEREVMRQKSRLSCQEEDLFHGTRANDPASIFAGEEGFDMRYSQAGLWGRGNYFAVNASYSDNYAHKAAPSGGGGEKQIFLARVIVGQTCHYYSEVNTLKMPPPLKASPSPQQTLLHSAQQLRYDSVSAETNGSKVFVVYNNRQAYPHYLIKYS